MSKYTLELRQILNNNIFDFSYNFVDEATKKKLEEMFINHYLFKEIGFETVGRFKHYLKMIFTEKLEYYEVLINTSKIEYDILNNYDLKEEFKKNSSNTITSDFSQNFIENITESTENKVNGKINNTINSDENVINKFSDTPQSNLNLDDNYLTNITKDNKNIINTENGTNETTTQGSNTKENINNSTSKNINDGSSNENYSLTRKGNIGVMTSTDMLNKHLDYQKRVTNIINQFLETECNCLFMGIY